MMSLRSSLRRAVAGCTPLSMQPATFSEKSATVVATAAQQVPSHPLEMGNLYATRYAAEMQHSGFYDATQEDINEKLHVASTGACNTQPISLTAKRVTSELIKAAMLRCDQFGDGDVAREEMRHQCVQLPPHLQVDLLDYFRNVPAFQPSAKERA